mgnify:FL=1
MRRPKLGVEGRIKTPLTGMEGKMAKAYVDSLSLLDWQRTLGQAAQNVRSPCGQALARIDAAVTAHPERIELCQYVDLLESIGQHCRPSMLAWNVGLSVDLPLGTDLGRAILGCKSLGTALHWLCQYFPLLQDSALLRLDVEEDWTTLSYKILDPTVWPRHEEAMYTLGIYARLLKAAAPDVWNHVLVTVEAEHEQVATDLEAIVQAGVVYGGQANSLRFPTMAINAPLGLAPACDPELLKKLSAKLSRKKRLTAMADRTQQMIYHEMNEGCVNQEHIARELGISSRTLRRRLAEEGHSFQELLDQCRMEFASLEFRIRRKLSLSDMALRLGYSEHSTFSRAFARWCGMAPQEYRRCVGLSGGQPIA